MTDIKLLKNKIIFDGHSNTREECETITLMCDNLAKSKDFKTVKYENGYAEFERISGSKELKFAPSIATLTINFDSHISKVVATEQDLEWTSSGKTNNVSVSATGGANNWTFTVTLADGYVIDTVTPNDNGETTARISNITTTTFISDMSGGGDTSMELTITSKLAPYRFKHYRNPESLGGTPLNIVYSDTAPSDTSKLWVKSSVPSEMTFGQQPTFIMDSQITPLYTFSTTANEHIMASVGDYVYFFGGKASPNSYYSPSNQILKYNVKTNTLTTLSITLPTSVYGNAGVAVVGTKIYIFGGNTTKRPSSSTSYSSSSAIQIFDTTTDSVRLSSSSLPNSLYYTRTVVVGTNIYLVGYAGYTNTLGNTIESTSILLFDTITESISTLSFSAPSRTSGIAVVGSKIYFFAGYNSTTSQYVKTVDVLDLNTGIATTLSGVEAPFDGIRPVCIAIGTMIYIFGGSRAILNNVYSFDTLTNEFVKTTIAGNYPMSGMKTGDTIYLYVNAIPSTLNKITANRQLTNNHIFVQQSYLTNLFDLMSAPTKVEIGIDKVYKGNASGNAELCDAYLHDGTNWVNVNTGEALTTGFAVTITSKTGDEQNAGGSIIGGINRVPTDGDYDFMIFISDTYNTPNTFYGRGSTLAYENVSQINIVGSSGMYVLSYILNGVEITWETEDLLTIDITEDSTLEIITQSLD